MAKNKVESQIGSLTLTIKSQESPSISLRVGDMPHTIEKLLTRAITLLQTSSQSEVFTQSYGPPKSRESQLWKFQNC
jgi:hypothetical protein